MSQQTMPGDQAPRGQESLAQATTPYSTQPAAPGQYQAPYPAAYPGAAPGQAPGQYQTPYPAAYPAAAPGAAPGQYQAPYPTAGAPLPPRRVLQMGLWNYFLYRWGPKNRATKFVLETVVLVVVFLVLAILLKLSQG